MIIKVIVIGLALGLGVGLRFFMFDLLMIISEEKHDRHEATRIVLEPGYAFQSMDPSIIIQTHILSIVSPVILLIMFFVLWYHWTKDSNEQEVVSENS